MSSLCEVSPSLHGDIPVQIFPSSPSMMPYLEVSELFRDDFQRNRPEHSKEKIKSSRSLSRDSPRKRVRLSQNTRENSINFQSISFQNSLKTPDFHIKRSSSPPPPILIGNYAPTEIIAYGGYIPPPVCGTLESQRSQTPPQHLSPPLEHLEIPNTSSHQMSYRYRLPSSQTSFRTNTTQNHFQSQRHFPSPSTRSRPRPGTSDQQTYSNSTSFSLPHQMSLPQSITDTLNTLGLPPLNQTLQPMMPEDNAPIPIRQLHRNPEKPLSGQYYSRNLADSYKMTTMPHHSTSHSSQSFRPSQTYFSSHEQRDRSSSPPHLGSQTERIAYSNWEERRTPSVDYTSPPPPLVHVPTTPRSRGPQIPLLSPKVVSLKKFKTRKERTLSPRPVVMTSASPRDEGGKDSTSIQSPTPSPTNMFPAMCSTIGIQTEPIVITSPTDDDNNVTERSVPNDALQHSLDSLAHLRRQLEEMTQSFNEEQARRMAIENQFESEKALWTGAQSDLSQDQSELLDKLRQLQIEGANQQTRFEDLSRQLEQSNQHRDQLEETITSLREQLREAKTETEMWSVQCDERGNEIQTLQDLLKSSNSDAERLKSEAQQLQGELYQKNTQLRTLKSQHAELEKENEELRRRLERDNTDVSIQTNWFIASESVSQLVAIQSKKQPPAPPDPTETQTYENLDDVDGVVVFTESDGRLLREFKELLDQSHHKDSVDLSVTPPDILPNSNQPPLVPMPATPSEQDPVKQNQDKSLVKTPKLGKSRMNRKQQSSAQQLSKYQSSTTQLPRTKMKAEETTIPPELARVLRELQDTERFRRTEKDVTAVFDWSGMNDRSLKQRFYAEDYEVDNVDYIVISAAALLRFTRNIISEQKKLSDSVDLIRTQFLKVVELFCRAYRQTSHHLGSITTLVDEIETVNSAMTVDLTCSSCLTILKDPITFIPCGHTLCRICAYKYGKQGKTQCPRCSDSDNVTRGYIRNYLVESLTTREEVKRQRMDETRLSNSQLAVTQALLEESVLTLPNARSIMDRYDEGLLASSDQFQT